MFFLGKAGIWRWVVGATAALSFMVGTAAAQDGAVAFLDGVSKEVLAEVTAPGLSHGERQQNFRAILQRVFGMDEICRQVLGRYGRTATAEQQQEFRRLFEDMLVVTWARRFQDYTGGGMRFGAATPIGNGDVLVSSQIDGSGNQPLNVEWRLRGEGEGYRLLDIKAEGTSMVLTYRSEYQTVLRHGGLDELNGLLRKKIEQLAGAG